MTGCAQAADPITVMLVESCPVVREGTRRVLHDTADIRVVTEAQDVEGACLEFEKCAPTVVVIEPRMRDLNAFMGLELIRRLKLMNPAVRILVFSDTDDEVTTLRALRLGAIGYLAKTRAVHHLVDAVRTVASGGYHLETLRAAELLHAAISGVATGPLEKLTPRELQLFHHFAEGRSTGEIAEGFSISPKTVGVHHTAIMKKLGLRTATELVRLAIRCEVIEP